MLDSVAASGVSMVLHTEAGALLLVMDRRGDVLWIEGAAGVGRGDLTRAGLTFAEETAKQLGCRAVCFWTARRGLMHKARRLGYVGTDREFTKALP